MGFSYFISKCFWVCIVFSNRYKAKNKKIQAKRHQIHPVLPVKNILESLKFYVNKLGFTIAFANDSKQPTYAGIRRDDIEINLQ